MRLPVLLLLPACSAPSFDGRLVLLADPAQDVLANAATVEVRLTYADGAVVTGELSPRAAEGEITDLLVGDGVTVDVIARSGDGQGGAVVALGRGGPFSFGPDAPDASVFIATPDSIATLPTTLREARGWTRGQWLPGDRVLVVGGGDGGEETSRSVELLGTDPSSPWSSEDIGEWERIGHELTRVRATEWDGQVLATGGTRGTGVDTLEGGWDRGEGDILRYDPERNELVPEDPLPLALMDHRAVATSQSGVALLGGYYSGDGAAQYSTRLVLAGPDGAEERDLTLAMREQHEATLVHADGSGGVLITGGFAGNAALRRVERWDGFPSGEITNYDVSRQLQLPRARHQATRVHDGVILVSGGATLSSAVDSGEPLRYLERWDEADETWVQEAASLLQARQRHTAFAIPGDRVLICGGQGADEARLADCELWDDGTRTVSPWAGGDLVTPRMGVAAVPFPDGRVLLLGGIEGPGAPSATMQLYTPPSF